MKAGCYVGVQTSPCPSLESQLSSTHTAWVLGYIGAAVLGGGGASLLWLAPAERVRNADAGSGRASMQGLTVNVQSRF